MWGPFEFRFQAWVGGGLCLGHFLSLGKGKEGTSRDRKGLQSRGTDRKMEGAPPCDYGTGTPSSNVQQPDVTDRRMIKLTDPANQTTKPI